jgi:hypothetical protein
MTAGVAVIGWTAVTSNAILFFEANPPDPAAV